jgi:hypothetical protein
VKFLVEVIDIVVRQVEITLEEDAPGGFKAAERAALDAVSKGVAGSGTVTMRSLGKITKEDIHSVDPGHQP